MKSLIIILLLTFSLNCYCQGTAGNAAAFETRDIVDMPTAGVIPKGDYAVDLVYFDGGGLAFTFNYALWRNFNIGAALSAQNFVGSGEITLQNIPAILLKYRFVNETIEVPAFAIGLSTRGTGTYSNSSNRYAVSSPGVFLALSKNFRWDLGSLATHAGFNYSFENVTDDFFINYYAGIEQSIGNRVAVNAEYNAGAFEWKVGKTKGKGFLNASLRYSLGYGFTLQFQFRDLLNNFKNSDKITRYFGIEWIGKH